MWNSQTYSVGTYRPNLLDNVDDFQSAVIERTEFYNAVVGAALGTFDVPPVAAAGDYFQTLSGYRLSSVIPTWPASVLDRVDLMANQLISYFINPSWPVGFTGDSTDANGNPDTALDVGSSYGLTAAAFYNDLQAGAVVSDVGSISVRAATSLPILTPETASGYNANWDLIQRKRHRTINSLTATTDFDGNPVSVGMRAYVYDGLPDPWGPTGMGFQAKCTAVDDASATWVYDNAGQPDVLSNLSSTPADSQIAVSPGDGLLAFYLGDLLQNGYSWRETRDIANACTWMVLNDPTGTMTLHSYGGTGVSAGPVGTVTSDTDAIAQAIAHAAPTSAAAIGKYTTMQHTVGTGFPDQYTATFANVSAVWHSANLSPFAVTVEGWAETATPTGYDSNTWDAQGVSIAPPAAGWSKFATEAFIAAAAPYTVTLGDDDVTDTSLLTWPTTPGSGSASLGYYNGPNITPVLLVKGDISGGFAYQHDTP